MLTKSQMSGEITFLPTYKKGRQPDMMHTLLGQIWCSTVYWWGMLISRDYSNALMQLSSERSEACQSLAGFSGTCGVIH